MSRSDMIGPRPLRPSPVAPLPNYIDNTGYSGSWRQTPITTQGAQNGVMPGCRAPVPSLPVQPALVIVEPPMEKSDKMDISSMWDLGVHRWEKSLELYKALRDHIDCLHKAAESGTQVDVGAVGGLRGKPEKIAVSDQTPKPSVDTSSPQMLHAHLKAKEGYLQDKLSAHQRAGHPLDHPDVQQRTELLGSVQNRIKNVESQGITSGPDEHKAWVDHYRTNPKGHSDAHVATGMTSHLTALGRGSVKTPSEQAAYQSLSTGTERSENAPRGLSAAPKSSKPTGSDFSLNPKQLQSMSSSQIKQIGTPAAGSTQVGTFSNKQVPQMMHAKGPIPAGGGGATVKETQPSITTAKSLIDSMIDMTKSPQGGEALMLAFASGEHPVLDKAGKGDDWISNKIRLLMHEGKEQKQAIAIAHNMAGRARKSQPDLFVMA